jgi:hypothetical protein
MMRSSTICTVDLLDIDTNSLELLLVAFEVLTFRQFRLSPGIPEGRALAPSLEANMVMTGVIPVKKS